MKKIQINNAVTVFTSGCNMHQTSANRQSAVHGSCHLRLRLPVTCLFGTELAPQSLLDKSIKLQHFFTLKGEKKLTDLKAPSLHRFFLLSYLLLLEPQMFGYTTTSVCGVSRVQRSHLVQKKQKNFNSPMITARWRISVKQGAELSGLSDVLVNAKQI